MIRRLRLLRRRHSVGRFRRIAAHGSVEHAAPHPVNHTGAAEGHDRHRDRQHAHADVDSGINQSSGTRCRVGRAGGRRTAMRCLGERGAAYRQSGRFGCRTTCVVLRAGLAVCARVAFSLFEHAASRHETSKAIDVLHMINRACCAWPQSNERVGHAALMHEPVKPDQGTQRVPTQLVQRVGASPSCCRAPPAFSVHARRQTAARRP